MEKIFKNNDFMIFFFFFLKYYEQGKYHTKINLKITAFHNGTFYKILILKE